MENVIDKKAAKKLAAQQQRIKLFKDYLEREEGLDRETAKKLKEKWLEILVASKLPEMKENLRSVLDYMEKLVEFEVFRRRMYEEERVEMGNQLTFQAQNHARCLEKLHELYLQRTQDLHEIYNQQVDQMKTQAENEFEMIREEEKICEENLKAVLYQMEMNQGKQEDLMKCDMFLRTDDEKSKNAEKSENLRAKLERQMEKKWYQISNTLHEYQQSTEHRRNHYAQLKARDKSDSKLIYSQMKKTQKLYEQIQQLKNYLENPNATDQKAILISDYREERSKFYDSFMYLKQVMAEEMKLDDTRLKDLILLSKEILEYLNHYLKKGEKILTLYSLCLKFETEKEKIVPVGRSLYTTKIPHNLANQLTMTQVPQVVIPAKDGTYKTLMAEDFNRFWQKIGKVRLSMIALSQKISDIKAENELLKKLVYSYFSQISLKN